ncbi:hypothetical protein CLF_108338, partial [Clonorchis sinensis]
HKLDEPQTKRILSQLVKQFSMSVQTAKRLRFRSPLMINSGNIDYHVKTPLRFPTGTDEDSTSISDEKFSRNRQVLDYIFLVKFTPLRNAVVWRFTQYCLPTKNVELSLRMRYRFSLRNSHSWSVGANKTLLPTHDLPIEKVDELLNLLTEGRFSFLVDTLSERDVNVRKNLDEMLPASETGDGLVQQIQLPGNITNERFSWVPGCCTVTDNLETTWEISAYRLHVVLIYHCDCSRFFLGLEKYQVINLSFFICNGFIDTDRSSWASNLATEQRKQKLAIYCFDAATLRLRKGSLPLDPLKMGRLIEDYKRGSFPIILSLSVQPVIKRISSLKNQLVEDRPFASFTQQRFVNKDDPDSSSLWKCDCTDSQGSLLESVTRRPGL